MSKSKVFDIFKFNRSLQVILNQDESKVYSPKKIQIQSNSMKMVNDVV